MEKITVKQNRVLDALKKHLAKKGYPPTVRELCELTNLSSTATVQVHLDHLENKGYIKRIEKTKNKRQANIIMLTPKGLNTLEELTRIISPMFDDVHERLAEFDIEYLKKGIQRLREAMVETIEIHI